MTPAACLGEKIDLARDGPPSRRTPTGMTPCFSYRFAPSLTLLVGLACSLGGCIDPKSIGQETDGEGSSGDTGSSSATDGMTTQSSGQSSGPTTSNSTGETDTGPGCPPIDPAPCTECECVGDQWNCIDLGCVDSCAGEACGVACLCPEDDPECAPGGEGLCTADGLCVGTPPPKLGFCEGTLLPGFEGELSTISGCADVHVYAHDAADERGLVVHVDQGLVAASLASGMPVHMELPATDPTVHIEGRAGLLVTEAECNDAVGPGIDIKETWLPTAGTVIIDVTAIAEMQADATVELVDVELHREQPGPAPIVVNVTFPNVSVGWLPG